MKKWISIFISIVALSVSAWLIIQPGVVKKIGSWKITKSDIRYRTEISKIYFPASNEEAALKQLEKSAQYLKILEKNGVTVTKEDLDDEEARILKNTQNPEQLEKIKKIFKDDKEAYRKNFVLPTLVDRFIYYDFFLNNPKVQIAAHSRAMDLIKATREQPQSFEKKAESLGLKVNTVVVGKTGLEISKDKLKQLEQSSKGKLVDLTDKKNTPLLEKMKQDMEKSRLQQSSFWRNELLSRMKENEVLSQPVSQDNRLLVVYLEKRKSNKEGIFKVVTIEKLNFDQWLAAQEKAK